MSGTRLGAGGRTTPAVTPTHLLLFPPVSLQPPADVRAGGDGSPLRVSPHGWDAHQWDGMPCFGASAATTVSPQVPGAGVRLGLGRRLALHPGIPSGGWLGGPHVREARGGEGSSAIPSHSIPCSPRESPQRPGLSPAAGARPLRSFGSCRHCPCEPGHSAECKSSPRVPGAALAWGLSCP